MTKFIKKYIIVIAGFVLGTVSGFLYWKFIGCESGACPIKSNSYLMTIYGAVAGTLLGSIVNDFGKKKKQN